MWRSKRVFPWSSIGAMKWYWQCEYLTMTLMLPGSSTLTPPKSGNEPNELPLYDALLNLGNTTRINNPFFCSSVQAAPAQSSYGYYFPPPHPRPLTVHGIGACFSRQLGRVSNQWTAPIVGHKHRRLSTPFSDLGVGDGVLQTYLSVDPEWRLETFFLASALAEVVFRVRPMPKKKQTPAEPWNRKTQSSVQWGGKPEAHDLSAPSSPGDWSAGRPAFVIQRDPARKKMNPIDDGTVRHMRRLRWLPRPDKPGTRPSTDTRRFRFSISVP